MTDGFEPKAQKEPPRVLYSDYGILSLWIMGWQYKALLIIIGDLHPILIPFSAPRARKRHLKLICLTPTILGTICKARGVG